jgi:hypothetical protein
MGWLILTLLIAGAVLLYARSSSTKRELPPSASPTPPPAPAPPAPAPRSLAAEEERIRRQIDAGAAKIRADAEREAAEVAFEEMDDAELEGVPRRGVWREDYVAKDDESRYLSRNTDGRPNLYLADAGDRLAIWSPMEGGGLINPRGPGLRQLGLYTSQARGADHYRIAYQAANLRKGQWIDLLREPKNPHDKNAVAMCAPGSRVAFAYVQRGRAPAVARRMDAGEDMAAVSLRGPGEGRWDDATFVLIGSRDDLTAMLTV